MRPILSALLLSATALSLSACGGAGGDDVAPPAPINRAPVFTSPSTASVPENTAGVVYTATATDPDSGQIRYRFLTTSDDAFLFDIDRVSGEISFLSPPDFENPQDANADNVYGIDLLVEDVEGASSTLLLQITVTDVVEGSSAALKPVGADFAEPVAVTGLGDGSGRLLVWERAGAARVLDPASAAVQTVPFLDAGQELRGGQIKVGDDGAVRAVALLADDPASALVFATVSGRADLADPLTAQSVSSASLADLNFISVDYAGAYTQLQGHTLSIGETGAVRAERDGMRFEAFAPVEGLHALGLDDAGELLAVTTDGTVLRLDVAD